MQSYCQETYHDALHWTCERIDREMRAITAYLREHPMMSRENIRALGDELRALRKARNVVCLVDGKKANRTRRRGYK